MKILIDLNHPAHIHYFKNFIWQMEAKGHVFCLVARDKEVLQILLKEYNFEFVNRGKGGKGLVGKLFYILKGDYIIWKAAKKFKPDIFLSFASTYAAHVSKIFGKPHIALDDTEHAKFELMMYVPFTDSVLNPFCFRKKLGPKQIFFNSFIELLYINKNYFRPNKKVLELLGVKENEKYALIRFVSWDASHDINQKGLTVENKIDLVELLSKDMKVYISSEGKIPPEIKKYELLVPPQLLHDVLYFATLYIGEGATTASEAALLGTPSIYINTLNLGYIEEEIKAGLVFQTTEFEIIKQHIANILLQENKKQFIENRDELIKHMIDPTAFLIWFIEQYPESRKIMTDNPKYQNLFKLGYDNRTISI